MPPDVRSRFEEYSRGKTTWDPANSRSLPGLAWNDFSVTGFGVSPSDSTFQMLCDRMLSGHYYPPDAIECFGLWQDENREIRPGDRILQRARLIPWIPSLALWAMTEVFVAERSPTRCELGYVTTERHFARGIWQAVLEYGEDELQLTIQGTTAPASLWFWLGLPLARYLQRRAWRRAIDEFVRLARADE